MKIDLNAVDRTQFMVHEHIISGGLLVYLIQPQHIGCSWTQQNKHLRSSLWDYEGNLISAGFPKFTNLGEKPEQFSAPKSLKGSTIVTKIDGSLLIVSKYKGHYIIRTRGTTDASTLNNGAEVELFKQQILNPFLESNSYLKEMDTWTHSLLFEWVTPANVIVIKYGDTPDWYFIGQVHHSDYRLSQQSDLDILAKHYNWKRPDTYSFTSVEDLVANVEKWQDKEGVCLYHGIGQQAISKIKSAKYLVLHRMKSELSSLEKVIDVWLGLEMPDYSTFYNKVVELFDFELAEQCRGNISKICDAKKEVDKIVQGMSEFVTKIKTLETRKEQAIRIVDSYGVTGRSGMCFMLLDSRALGAEQYKKLIFQVLKN